MRKDSRGKWAGLTAVKISKLLGCSVSTTKSLLYKLKNTKEVITEKDIGELIYEYKFKKHLQRLKNYLK